MTQHLTLGSTCPPLVEGKLRLYVMRFCPFSLRILLTATAKNIPVDIVYVQTTDKPEWMAHKNPAGKVPTMELKDGRVLYESNIICDYLDESFPGVKLQANDPFQKAWDRIQVENFSKIGGIFYKLIYIPNIPKEDIPKLAAEYQKVIQDMSDELGKRGTTYFAGNDVPGMLDYMIWPWFERRPVISHQYPELNLGSVTGPIDNWVEMMKKDAAVAAFFLSPEIHHKYNLTVREGRPDYNMLINQQN